MLQSREILEENLINVIDKIKTKRKLTKQIKDELAKYDILHGDTQGYISNAKKEIPALNPRVLFLLTEAVHQIAHQELGELALTIIPTEYFTESEIKTSRTYSGELDRVDDLTLPLTFENVLYLGKNIYLTAISAKLIKRMMDSMLIHYNFSTQREATVKQVKDQIIYEPTVNKNNILEMVDHLKNSTLYPYQISINCAVRSSETGEEVTYENTKGILHINKGTKIDIIDGYHRCKAIQNALSIDPSIDMMFPVLIGNLTEKAAQRQLGQMSKQMPISKVRSMELLAERYSDDVIQQLKEESELKGRIAQTETVHRSTNELVSYSVISDTIDEVFDMKTKADAMDVGDQLVEFYNRLFGYFENEFISNVQGTRKHSIINHNNMVGIGFVCLAKRMIDEGIKFKNVKDIVNSIDWSRDNPLWEEQGILTNGSFTDINKARKNIKEYFRKLDIKEILEEGVTNG